MTDREFKIINTYDQCVAAGGDRVFISYSGYESRRCMPAHWTVYRVKNGEMMITDPKAHWMDNQRKTFTVAGRDKIKSVLRKAIAWANIIYSKREFVRNRMGDYVEREVNEKFPIPRRSG